MEIGRKEGFFFSKLEDYWIRIMVFILCIITVTVYLSYCLLANYTNVIEKMLINMIAKLDGYTYNFDGEYFNLSRLEENGNQIEIIYRYDENFTTYIDEEKIGNAGMYVVKNEFDESIQSENNVLYNIENEFNNFKLRQTSGVGGGYTIQSISDVLSFNQIVYKSNLCIDRLDIMKKIIELEPIDTSSIIYYHGGEETFADVLENEYLDEVRKKLIKEGYGGEELDIRLEKEKARYEVLYRDNKDKKEDLQPITYDTYNIIILSPEKQNKILKTSDNNDYTRNNTCAIVGACSNNEEIILDMKWTMYKLEIITLLENTILL